ncbi:hypothetical protein M441DRAFT_348909 [Trichoderma asperellum CBS 433.97]|uniref:Uncharacterized protein n=1 Tax=Trichoderma asperellum (strain ATCC 204424 / CBS 433.97 / NBRC 101777) TaxID=1042311 RepID=A0A2T3ZI06_TRIA4|nr:hypothetical protein M441DRAFT_348909 [Trichoderma asperellum CBS 433.97]PTB44438.1 hypothetical protein M441DRAFT_348909 [Trichoderma asperellum CBS 433.97]
MARQTDTTKPKGTTKPRHTKSKDASSVNGAGKKDKKELPRLEFTERALVAASRRDDRTLELRIESAYKASAIHKARTGKGFFVSEAGVLNKEMYEEDALLPRFTAMGLSAPPGFVVDPNTVRDLLAESDRSWRENDVNKMFAQMFPHADEHARRFSQQSSPLQPYSPPEYSPTSIPSSISPTSPPPAFESPASMQLPQHSPQFPQWDSNNLDFTMQQPQAQAQAQAPTDLFPPLFDFSSSSASDQSMSSMSTPSFGGSPIPEFLHIDPAQTQHQMLHHQDLFPVEDSALFWE